MAEKTQKIQQYKIDAVNAIKESILKYKDFILSDFRGLNVEKITELRRKLREHDSVLKIVKNDFTRIALKNINYPEIGDFLTGPTALTFVEKELGQAAKIIFEYAKNESIRIKGGVIDKHVLTADEVEAFSKLPGKNELISILLSAMTGPIRNLMYVMNGVTGKLARTLKALADKKAKE